MPYCPLRRFPIAGFPRLACLIHAANVRSEPGSNPSKVFVTHPEVGLVQVQSAVVRRDSKDLAGPAADSPALARRARLRPTWARVWVTPNSGVNPPLQ